MHKIKTIGNVIQFLYNTYKMPNIGKSKTGSRLVIATGTHSVSQ